MTTDQLPGLLDTWTRLQALAAACTTDDEAAAVATQVAALARRIRAARWQPYPWQHPHTHPEGWESTRAPGVCDEHCSTLPATVIPISGTWVQLGGRGTGKTEGVSHYINRHAEGPPCDTRVPGGHRIVIVAPTQGDAVEACVTGPSGLQTINPAVRLITSREGTTVRWPNGARARLLGAHGPADVERLRAAGNSCVIWLEEFAAMRRLDEVRSIADFGLRLGDRAHWVASSTPKNHPAVKALLASPGVIKTRGRTRDADRLPASLRAHWEDLYGGTTLGRQELDGEELGDVPGALWVPVRPDYVEGAPNKDERPGIENDRVTEGDYGWTSHDPQAPASTARFLMHRVIVAVDPPGGRTECGITVHGTVGNHGYLLADLSTAGPPDKWAKIALDAYYDYGAEGVAAEHTYGGDMVRDVFTTRNAAVPIFRVPTKVGKKLRAEPVVALAQQHRLHHVGRHPGVEGELTTWVEGEGESPNRLDAYVHGFTYLMVRSQQASVGVPGRRRS